MESYTLVLFLAFLGIFVFVFASVLHYKTNLFFQKCHKILVKILKKENIDYDLTSSKNIDIFLKNIESIFDLLKKNENRKKENFVKILDLLSSGVIFIDKNKRILYFNKSFLDIFSLEKNIQSKKIEEVLRYPEVLEAFELIASEKEKNKACCFSFGIPAFKKIDFQVSYINENIFAGIFEDKTELYRANTLAKELTSNISHELRTPISIISGFLELLLNEKVEAKDRNKFLQQIFANTKRLKTLTDDLMKISTTDYNKILSESQAIDLKSIVDKVISLLFPLALEKGIQMKNNLDEDITILGDESLLEKVFSNLIENGIKYGRKNGFVKIYTEKSADLKRIVVEDNGFGISEEEKEKVFERFYRTKKALKEKGAGLGLPIVKKILESHNAKIWIESKIDSGTKVFIEF